MAAPIVSVLFSPPVAGAQLSLRILPTASLTYSPSGETLESFGGNFTSVGARLVSLPPTDQSGWVDSSNNSVTGWAYEVDGQWHHHGRIWPLNFYFVLPSTTPNSTDVSTLPTGNASSLVRSAFKKDDLFDNRLSAYNLKAAHLRRSRVALGQARRGTGFLRIATIGESTTAGQGASPASTTSWPGRLRTLLATAGVASAGTGLVAGWRADTVGTDPRWVFNGSWGARDGGNNFITNYSEPGTTAVFTSTTSGTIARLYFGGNTNAFEASIDGGAFTAVNPSTGAQVEVREWTGLANTTHSIAVRATGGPPEVLGAEVRSGTSGVLLYNAGISGNQVEVAALTGFHSVTQTTTASTAFNADLAFLMYGINDANASVPLETFRTRYQTAINSIRANGADLVLVTSNPASPSSPLGPYMTVLYELAALNDLPLIDVADRMGTYAQANANGLMSDGFHPNAAGYEDIAQTIFGALRDGLGL